MPRLWPLIAPWLRIPRAHVYRAPDGTTHAVVATSGVDQGDHLSALLAPVGVASLHEAIEEKGIAFAVQDDTYCLVDPSKTGELLDEAMSWDEFGDVAAPLRAFFCEELTVKLNMRNVYKS